MAIVSFDSAGAPGAAVRRGCEPELIENVTPQWEGESWQ